MYRVYFESMSQIKDVIPWIILNPKALIDQGAEVTGFEDRRCQSFLKMSFFGRGWIGRD